MIKDELDKIIRNIPDFPKEGINFKDITPLLLDSDISNYIIDSFIDKLEGLNIDAIVGVESRGFLFGFLLANKMGVPFIPARKAGKLPGETVKYKYALEYGFAELEMHKSDVKKDWNILVHDDLLATGGTACAAACLVNKLEANIVGFAFIVNLSFLKGNERLLEYSNNIISLIDY
tara:strand:+ start:948 stop:1475 length:528 start_codon:yes stop_codon:yes gene_type:complete